MDVSWAYCDDCCAIDANMTRVWCTRNEFIGQLYLNKKGGQYSRKDLQKNKYDFVSMSLQRCTNTTEPGFQVKLQ